MNSKGKLAIICAVLISVAAVLWMTSRPLQLVLNATPFLLLLGVWIFLVIRKFPNGLRN